MSIEQTLIAVLTITNYPEKDRQPFKARLFSLAGQQALVQYVRELPEERQKELEQQIEGKSPEEVSPLFEKYLDEESFKKHFAHEVEVIIGDYLKEVAPDLTEEQKQKLDELFVAS